MQWWYSLSKNCILLWTLTAANILMVCLMSLVTISSQQVWKVFNAVVCCSVFHWNNHVWGLQPPHCICTIEKTSIIYITLKEDAMPQNNHPFILQHVSKPHARVVFSFQLAICMWYYYNEWSITWFYYVFGYIFITIDFKGGNAAMILISSCRDLGYYQKSVLTYMTTGNTHIARVVPIDHQIEIQW